MTCNEVHEHVVHTTHLYTICMLEYISVYSHISLDSNSYNTPPLGGARLHISYVHKSTSLTILLNQLIVYISLKCKGLFHTEIPTTSDNMK